MNIRKLAISTALAGALMLGSVANAAVLTLEFSGFKNGFRTGTINVGASTINNAAAGLFVFDVTNIDGDPPIDIFNQLMAFCLEANVGLEDPADYDLVGAASYFNNATTFGLVQQLFSKHFGDTGTRDTDAAFQLALWEIIYDSNNLDLSTGNFSATGFSSALGIAAGWLANLGSGDSYSGLWALQAPGVNVRNVSQDLITWQVPEPATLALLGIGLIGFGAMRRRQLS
jgi:hypothetical protein